jgi:hypothetical protein
VQLPPSLYYYRYLFIPHLRQIKFNKNTEKTTNKWLRHGKLCWQNIKNIYIMLPNKMISVRHGTETEPRSSDLHIYNFADIQFWRHFNFQKYHNIYHMFDSPWKSWNAKRHIFSNKNSSVRHGVKIQLTVIICYNRYHEPILTTETFLKSSAFKTTTQNKHGLWFQICVLRPYV